jgi:hypothetical protein
MSISTIVRSLPGSRAGEKFLLLKMQFVCMKKITEFSGSIPTGELKKQK